jgi:cytochrome c oxidase assembly protein subunit 17
MPPPPHAPIGPDGQPLRICCSCKETKAPRDECVLFKGEDNCKKEIEAHKDCLRALGFKV